MATTKQFKIFVDFDGTITLRDVGEHLFLHFGDTIKVNNILQRIKNSEINFIQGWQELFDVIKNVPLEEIKNFVSSIEIDKTFHQLIDFTNQHNFDIYVLSDGFEFYLKQIFKKENLDSVKFYCNTTIIDENGNLSPVFPYRDEECTQCANCKRNHIIENSSDEDFTIYIGNGISDQCPAQYCDFIFAKESLLKFCEKERITFFPYNNFDDVIFRLKSLMEKKRLKKRYQANLKRQAVYIQG